jgi:hypothetical protein
MKRSVLVVATLLVVAAGFAAHILTQTNERERAATSPKYIFKLVPTGLQSNQWQLTYRPSPWTPQNQWQLDFGSGEGAVTTFPPGQKFHVGEVLDFGEIDGSWRVKSIEGQPSGGEVLPRLILARIKTWK